MDLCGLDFIKYDFVGRFERLDEDVGKVLQILQSQRFSAFDLGKKSHPTNSDSRLTQLYQNKVSRLRLGFKG